MRKLFEPPAGLSYPLAATDRDGRLDEGFVAHTRVPAPT